MVKICDLGCSIHSAVMRGNTAESVGNVSSESRTDIWDIGLLTYELLFGSIASEVIHHHNMAKVVLFA